MVADKFGGRPIYGSKRIVFHHPIPQWNGPYSTFFDKRCSQKSLDKPTYRSLAVTPKTTALGNYVEPY